MECPNLLRWLEEDEGGLRLDQVDDGRWELQVENPNSEGESLDGTGNEILLFYGRTPQSAMEKAERWFLRYFLEE